MSGSNRAQKVGLAYEVEKKLEHVRMRYYYFKVDYTVAIHPYPICVH